MLGSDYPYPLGEQRVGKLIRGMKANEQLTEEQVRVGVSVCSPCVCDLWLLVMAVSEWNSNFVVFYCCSHL